MIIHIIILYSFSVYCKSFSSVYLKNLLELTSIFDRIVKPILNDFSLEICLHYSALIILGLACILMTFIGIKFKKFYFSIFIGVFLITSFNYLNDISPGIFPKFLIYQYSIFELFDKKPKLIYLILLLIGILIILYIFDILTYLYILCICISIGTFVLNFVLKRNDILEKAIVIIGSFLLLIFLTKLLSFITNLIFTLVFSSYGALHILYTLSPVIDYLFKLEINNNHSGANVFINILLLKEKHTNNPYIFLLYFRCWASIALVGFIIQILF